MSKKSSGSKPSVPQKVHDQNSQQTNPNKGTSGTNIHYDKATGHRGTQLDQHRRKD